MEKFFFNIAPARGKPHVTFRVRAHTFEAALALAKADAASNFGSRPNLMWVVNGGLED